MGLQVRAFKSCKKWTPAYKYYWQWKIFWIYDHPPLQKQSNKDWNTPIHLENSGPSIKDSLIFPFLTTTFNSCFQHQLWVKWVCIHIGNSSGYYTKLIHDSRNDCGCLTLNEMHIELTSLRIYSMINYNIINTSMVAYLLQKCIFIFNENIFIFNEKYLTFKKIYLYSIKYICIQ